MRKTFFLLLFIAGLPNVFKPSLTHASLNATLPTYHWSYHYLKELQYRGLCLNLLPGNQPYSRRQVAQSLLWIKQQINIGTADSHLQNIIQKLANEFYPEINALKTTIPQNNALEFRTNLRTNVDWDESDHSHYRGVYRASIGLSFGEHVQIKSAGILDQYIYDDATYQGAKWRGFAGYTEYAYLNGYWRHFQFKLGRDYLKWGLGESGTLMLSNIARPLDQVLIALDFRPFRFTFFAAQLDEYTPERIESIRIPVRRFLSGHRLDASLWNGRLQAAVSELMLYGGPNETFNLAYLNPFQIYHGAHKNLDSVWGNILPTIDLLIYPLSNWHIYTSLLIDDIQVEKTGPIDLEPNEIGWLIGSQFADPFQISGLTVGAEYVRIANRTYKTEFPFEIFTYRGKTLGHPLGNDVDQWCLSVIYWLTHDLWLKLDYSRTRQGEGSVFTPWDAPWMERTLAEGYSEPFPTGEVELTERIQTRFTWFPHRRVLCRGNISYANIRSHGHQPGAKTSCWEFKLMAELNWQWHWNLDDENE